MNTRIFRRIAWMFLLCLATLLMSVQPARGEADSEFRNTHPTYRLLRGIGLSGQSASVTDLTLEREGAKFLLKSGTIHLLEPVEGRVTGAVFLGQGRFSVVPPHPREQFHLSMLTRSEGLDDEFDELVLRFTDSTYEELSASLTFEQTGPHEKAQKALERAREQLRDGKNYGEPNVAAGYLPYNLDGRILVDLLRSDGAGLFHGWFDGKRYGLLLWLVDPLGAPYVAPEEVVLVGLDSKSLGIWAAYHQSSHSQSAALEDEWHAPIDVTLHQIDATADKDKLRAKSAVSFRARRSGVQAVPINLYGQLRVEKITDSKGRSLHFIQEDKDEDADLFVVLAEPMDEGDAERLVFEYAGEKALQDSGGKNYTLVARTNWYPNVSFEDRANFEMTLRTKKGLEMVATGDKVSEGQEDGWSVTRWKSNVPLKVAGFNFGLFKKSSEQDKEIDTTIETYANRELPDYLRSLQRYAGNVRGSELSILASLNTTSLMDKARAEAQLSLRIFTQYFGELPYGRIAMTQQPFFNFGQAWPMLVYMPVTAFIDSTHRHQLLGRANSSFFKYVAAHEVAHQWWGHVVGWNSYRDQWMSEGFAEFSASLFAQMVYGADKFRELWKEHRERILESNRKGHRPYEVGPLSMGYRLDTAKTGSVARSMIYPKGAFVLHMLRMMMWTPQEGDAPFIAMMRDFVKSHFNQDVSTRDFRETVSRHMTPEMDLDGNGRMDWFFRQWVDGTEIPEYRLDYKIEPAEQGRAKLIGAVTQSGVSDSFKMRVPIYIQMPGKEPVRLGVATLSGNASSDFEVLLPQKPEKVALCWYEDVLRIEK